MKKITLIASLFFTSLVATAQVTVGEGTGIDQHTPINPYYNYTYTQSIYLASEINASGDITGISYYFDLSGINPKLDKSNQWDVWIGHTSKSSFESKSDWIPMTSDMQKFTGEISHEDGVVTITFSEPFAYNGTDNIVIAVDENKIGFNSTQDAFFNHEVEAERSIYKISSDININNESLPEATNRDVWVPNITFLGITGEATDECVVPTELMAENITNTQADIKWTAEGEDNFEIIVIPATEEMPEEGVVTSTNPHTAMDLTANTEYKVYVRTVCEGDEKSEWSEMYTFTTANLSIEDNIIEGLRVFPNPASDVLSISAKEILLKVEVFNTLGQKVLENDFQNTDVKLNLQNIEKGSYTIKLTTEKTASSFRIVKK
ncbi:T9SS type A sorting domain-containing protein [Aureivirga sp. CE67]|uniref:T9SS type A sorting domain-containing protein n=1 Tax=Aureivirga sp. CE67 TaxID=1788983 RepID=UPI0018CB2D5B|nr:T9SS type A sorting domain-containing protein [Aureivirga sp. CE67]